MTGYIQLANGRQLTNPPTPEQIDWNDLILGCSREHRFSKQLPRGITWTVALHQVVAYHLALELYPVVPNPVTALEERNNLSHKAIQDALAIHDAHEGILGDTATPLKTPERRALELEFDRAIYPAAGLDVELRDHELVKYVDRLCCAAEAITFLGKTRESLEPWGLDIKSLMPMDLALATKEVRVTYHDQWVDDPTGYERYKAVLHRVGLV